MPESITSPVGEASGVTDHDKVPLGMCRRLGLPLLSPATQKPIIQLAMPWHFECIQCGPSALACTLMTSLAKGEAVNGA